jgi:hypothetical protein
LNFVWKVLLQFVPEWHSLDKIHFYPNLPNKLRHPIPKLRSGIVDKVLPVHHSNWSQLEYFWLIWLGSKFISRISTLFSGRFQPQDEFRLWYQCLVFRSFFMMFSIEFVLKLTLLFKFHIEECLTLNERIWKLACKLIQGSNIGNRQL